LGQGNGSPVSGQVKSFSGQHFSHGSTSPVTGQTNDRACELAKTNPPATARGRASTADQIHFLRFMGLSFPKELSEA
jgi:hypothetical protein